MEYGLGTTMASIAFLFVIIYIYSTKDIKTNLESRLFKYTTICCSILCISTMAYAILLKKFDIFWLNLVSWRIYVLSIITFIELFITYIIVLIENYKNKTITELWHNNFIFRITMMSFSTIQIIYLFLPHMKLYEVFDKHNIIYTTPLLSLISCLLILVAIGFTFRLVNKHKDKMSAEVKKSCYIIAFSTFLGITQLFFPNISIYPFAAVIITMIVYLIFSNPDIEMSKELVIAKDTIKNSSKTKIKFLSDVTSEMKTPVSYITSLSTNLENMETLDKEEIRNTMQQIISSGNNLLDIVNNVLNISNIESGKTNVVNNTYKIRELINDAVNVARAKIGSKPVKLEVNISETLAEEYQGDAIKIYQALQNVLTNAAKYTEVGKITLEVQNTKVPLGEKILFKVADTGNGIKEEEKDKVFVKGERLENSLENEIEGSGYGLAITKEYLEMIDGKIWFETEYRVGTTFYIEVPQKVVHNEEEKVEEEIIIGDIDCSNLTALVLDDNKLNVKVIKRLLEKYGFKVVTVSSGQECIYKIKSEEHFDIIFMDQVMDEMTGTDTMKALRGLEGYDIPPLILLTANAVAGMKEQYIAEGFDDYIPKPITTASLEEVLNRFFKKTK